MTTRASSLASMLFLALFSSVPALAQADSVDLFAPVDKKETKCNVPVENGSVRLDQSRHGSIRITPALTDWSAYDAISFRIRSSRNEGDELTVVLNSNPDGVDFGNYYSRKLRIDHIGTKEYILPFNKFHRHRDPVGLQQIQIFDFASRGWGMQHKPGFRIDIDSIRLRKTTPPTIDAPAKALREFREIPASNRLGVTPAQVAEIAAMLPEKPELPGANIHNRNFWNNYPVSDWIVTRAEERLAKSPPRVTFEDWKSRNDSPSPAWKSRMEILKEQRRYLAAMVIQECKENRGRFLPRISETLEAMLEFPDPTADYSSRFEPECSLHMTEGWRYIVLSNAEWMPALSTTLWLLDDKLPAELRTRVRVYLDEWIFTPMFRNLALPKETPFDHINHNFWAMFWLEGANNWNPYCYFRVLGIALGCLESRTERAYLVANAVAAQKNYTASLTRTGYISEGIGYWMMGFSDYVRLAGLIDFSTGGKLDILAEANENIRNAFALGRNFMLAPGGLYPHFADYGTAGKAAPFRAEDLDLLNQAAKSRIYEVQDGDMVAAYGVSLFSDYMRTLGWLNRNKNLPGDSASAKPFFFDPETMLLVSRDTGNAEVPFSFAIKGGHNGELHNHNDLGSYVIGRGDRIHTGDPGVPYYLAKTRGRVNSSESHPVPVVNGKFQGGGKQYAARVISFFADDAHSTLLLDLRKGYDAPEVQKLQRTATHFRAERRVVISDEFEYDAPGSFGGCMISYFKPEQLAPNVWRLGDLRAEFQSDSAELEFAIDQIDAVMHSQAIPWRLNYTCRSRLSAGKVVITVTP